MALTSFTTCRQLGIPSSALQDPRLPATSCHVSSSSLHQVRLSPPPRPNACLAFDDAHVASTQQPSTSNDRRRPRGTRHKAANAQNTSSESTTCRPMLRSITHLPRGRFDVQKIQKKKATPSSRSSTSKRNGIQRIRPWTLGRLSLSTPAFYYLATTNRSRRHIVLFTGTYSHNTRRLIRIADRVLLTRVD
uniref:Uncharacterized protein n=1 Tax=Mycena chlorophos TaxID=658473 RepID=A0ABQ0LNM4_MYCCL|nr:predicted protein [Mycena chlorophos]